MHHYWPALSALLCLLFAQGVDGGEYPLEVREAFLGECTTGGAPEAVCRCILEKMQESVSLEQLQSGDYAEELLVGWAKACVLAAPMDSPAAVLPNPEASHEGNWGPACLAYFERVESWCNDSTVPDESRVVCEDFLPSVEQSRALDPPDDREVLVQMDESCRMAHEAFELIKDSMAP